ncbi:hypothetical protein [Otariodibacter oris]|uniref:Uncharacterized protein n=1 Tax=Otariodibacter oris TaxID=1032623 RepID=A0A420XHB0_9PAST|nr:hypothetical protein [Otariodibacter oris]QGM81191.1 hypothetical protein A6A10_07110 [Otariodibacter oris]RKR72749.1 hypothetical protein DES31_0914 [Otariodibacter oris]
MKNWEIRSFHKDLQTFAELLEQYHVPCQIDPIYTIIGTLSNPHSHSIKYTLNNIPFKISKKISGSLPVDMEEYQIFFDNSISIDKSNTFNEDCISEYLFEINITGYTFEKEAPLKSCWHLDRHIESESGGDGIPRFTHPSYHFQFGGRFIDKCDTGDLGILSAPRIPHPPMDIFLGIHFIINNFYSRKDYNFVNEILENYDYQEIIKRAQERLWVPYFKAFSLANTHNDFTINKVFPLYIK